MEVMNTVRIGFFVSILLSMVFSWELAGVGMMACFLYCLSLVLSYRGGSQFREKSSPYECGFEPIGGARSSFSLRFFLLAMVFMIFDVEVVLLFPIMAGLMMNFVPVSIFVQGFFFLVLLLLGLWFEWSEGSLEWL
uniref:NADH-ubiquinone oxidoreductase chain 3 n=1 Tax=Anadara consociata TaxID=2592665 RepID=A0A7D0KV24_9BIVA|nr:NADH dehydrogenase subunit 3 [Anadara sp. SS-2018]QDH82323.1 NADH dehydrogenase subunit 3 [Anadara consociata]